MVPPVNSPQPSNPPDIDRANHAFTLIELLVVVAIITLVIAILLPALARAKERAKVAKCLANLHGIAAAVNIYAADSDSYLPPPAGSIPDSAGVTWVQEWDFGYSLSLNQWQPSKGVLSPYFPINGVPTCPSMPPEMKPALNLTNTTPTLSNPPVNIYMMSSFISTKYRLFDISKPSGTAIFGECGSISNNAAMNLLGALSFRDTLSATVNITANSPIEPNLMCLHNKQGGVAWADGHATMESPWFCYSPAIPMPAARAVVYQRYNFGWFMPPPDVSSSPNASTATAAQIRAWAQVDEFFTISR